MGGFTFEGQFGALLRLGNLGGRSISLFSPDKVTGLGPLGHLRLKLKRLSDWSKRFGFSRKKGGVVGLQIRAKGRTKIGGF